MAARWVADGGVSGAGRMAVTLKAALGHRQASGGRPEKVKPARDNSAGSGVLGRLSRALYVLAYKSDNWRHPGLNIMSEAITRRETFFVTRVLIGPFFFDLRSDLRWSSPLSLRSVEELRPTICVRVVSYALVVQRSHTDRAKL